jgi:hypothetical protein
MAKLTYLGYARVVRCPTHSKLVGRVGLVTATTDPRQHAQLRGVHPPNYTPEEITHRDNGEWVVLPWDTIRAIRLGWFPRKDLEPATELEFEYQRLEDAFSS